MSDETAEERQAREQAADDQWRASVSITANQAKVFHDALVKAGFSDDAAAIITGHWIAASVASGPMAQMVERFMAITPDPHEEND